MQPGLWKEKFKKAQKAGGRCLDLEHILINRPSAKKAAIFMKETGLTSRFKVPNTEENH